MAKKKTEYLETNLPQLIEMCETNNFQYEKLSKYHYRIMGGTHIIDVWPSRMVYHRVSGEVINAREDYIRPLNAKFDKLQVFELLAYGRLPV